MGAHALIAASGFAITVPCPGSVVMQMAYPELHDSPASREGTAAHDVAMPRVAAAARGDTSGAGLLQLDGTASNGEAVTQDMLDGANVVVDYCLDLMRRLGCFTPVVEQYLTGAVIHPESGGTPDVWLYSDRLDELHVIDYKFGHRTVSAFENWQLLAYLFMVLAEIGHQPRRIALHIVQPRAFRARGVPSVWEVPADLTPYLDRLRAAAVEALGPDPRTVAGRHCRDCNGRHACDTLTAAAEQAMVESGRVTATNLTAAQAGLELRMIDQAETLLKARRTGLEELALALHRKGQALPHWRVQPGYGRERWRDAAAVRHLAAAYKKDLHKAPEPVTPTEARKRGVPDDVVAVFTERPDSGLKLVADDGSHARYVFQPRSTTHE